MAIPKIKPGAFPPNLPRAIVRRLLRERRFAVPVTLSIALGLSVSLPVFSLVRIAGMLPPRIRSALPFGLMPDPGLLALPFVSWTAMPSDLQREGLEAMLVIALALALLGLGVACVSAAVLLLGRAASRRHAVAVRRALGATRRRLVPRFALRCAGSAGIGAIAGAGIGSVLAAVLHSTWPGGADGAAPIGLAALLVGIGVTVGAAFLAGAGALVAVSRASDLRATLTTGVRATAGRRETELRRALVALQFAATIALLTGAGLLARNAAPVQHATGPDSNADSLLAVRFGLPAAGDDNASRRAARFKALLADVRRIPGVHAESLSSAGAWSGMGPAAEIMAECRCVIGNVYVPFSSARVRLYSVSPGFFRMLGVPLSRGRGIMPSDTAGARRVAIVNQAFVNEVLRRTVEPGAILDRELWLGGVAGPVHYMIGAAENIHSRALGAGSGPAPSVFLSAFQHPPGAGALAVLSKGDPERIIAAARGVIQRTFPDARIEGGASFAALRAAVIAPTAWFGMLFVWLAAGTLLLAAYGLYSAVRGNTARRRREIGIRMALGARGRQVVGGIIAESVRLVAFGTGLGLFGALMAARALQLRIIDVRLFDLVLFGGIALVLACVAVLAAVPAARRAVGTRPAVTLRER